MAEKNYWQLNHCPRFFWLLLLHSNICSLLTLTNWHPVTPCVPGECDACFLIHLMMRTRSQAAKKPPLPPSPSVVHWPWQTLGERERRERRERSATHPTHLSDSLTRRIIDSGLTTGLSIWLTCEYQSPSLTFPKTYFIWLYLMYKVGKVNIFWIYNWSLAN